MNSQSLPYLRHDSVGIYSFFCPLFFSKKSGPRRVYVRGGRRVRITGGPRSAPGGTRRGRKTKTRERPQAPPHDTPSATDRRHRGRAGPRRVTRAHDAPVCAFLHRRAARAGGGWRAEAHRGRIRAPGATMATGGRRPPPADENGPLFRARSGPRPLPLVKRK